MITVALTVFGLAGILGSVIFSRIYGITRYTYIVCSLAFSAIVLLSFRFMSSWTFTAVLYCALWGVFVTSFNVSFQNETMLASPGDAVAIIMSLFSGIYNVGIAMGSIIGGIVTDTSGVGDIGYVGGMFLLIGTAITAFVLIPSLKKLEKDRGTAS